MAEENQDGQEKTEEATEQQRENFRKRGEVAYSREVSSVFVLFSIISFVTFYADHLRSSLQALLSTQFSQVAVVRINPSNVLSFMASVWWRCLGLILPFFVITAVISTGSTFAQTRLNFSFTRIKPNWQRVNLFSGLKRMLSGQSLMELGKGLGKMFAVSIMSYLILFSEWSKLPSLLNLNLTPTWSYWGRITSMLFWSVSLMLLVIAFSDYFYNYWTLEKKMKMSKQELKEEYKQRELDPLIKNRMRKMQRDLSFRKTVDATKDATVVIVNPTHFSVALKYELGMGAPKVVAKGLDFIALEMRKVAKECDIPIVENKPLARTLYKMADVDAEIPQSLYKAVSEIIRYVFKLKGIRIGPS